MTTPKLLGPNTIKLRVALVSLGVLAVGLLIAPPARQTPLTPPAERPAPLLDAQAATREAARPFEGLNQVSGRVRDLVVVVRGDPEPVSRTVADFRPAVVVPPPVRGFGVTVTGAGQILTHERALAGRATVRVETPDGTQFEAHLTAYERATGLVLLQAAGAAGSAPSFAASVEAGQVVAAYAPEGADRVVVPVFVTSVAGDRYRIAAVGATPLPGTPLYTLAGELLGIADGSREQPSAFRAREAADRLVSRAASGSGQPSSFGVVFQPLVGTLTNVFGQTGALVADVIPESPAAASGIEPGDVIVAIGDTLIQSPEAAQTAIASLFVGTQVSVQVRRGTDVHTRQMQTAAAFDVRTHIGRVPHRQVAPLTAGEVFSTDTLSAVDVPADAHVLSLNGRPASSRAAALGQVRRARETVLVYLQSPQGERFFAALDRPHE